MDACKKMVRELTDEAIEIVRIFPESDFLTVLRRAACHQTTIKNCKLSVPCGRSWQVRSKKGGARRLVRLFFSLVCAAMERGIQNAYRADCVSLL